MRPLLLAALLSLPPSAALAQLAPRSLALEAGFTLETAEARPGRAPVGLVATWWLADALDATARVAWVFAPRTEDRASDDRFEAGLGVRWALARGRIRPELLAGASVVELPGAAFFPAAGLRLSAGAALEAFVARDVSVSALVEGAHLLLAGEEGGPGAAVALRVEVYF
jgi:hypothetical protein